MNNVKKVGVFQKRIICLLLLIKKKNLNDHFIKLLMLFLINTFFSKEFNWPKQNLLLLLLLLIIILTIIMTIIHQLYAYLYSEMSGFTNSTLPNT